MEDQQSKNEDLRVQRTKYLLREAIAKLLEKKDLKDISIQQISKKAMIYRTTFYAHYSDKNDLLEDYLIEAWKNEIYLEEGIEKDKLIEKYWEGLLETVKYFERYSKLYIQLSESKSIISKQNLIFSTIKKFFILLLNLIQPDDSKIRVSKERISEFYTAGYLNSILNWIHDGAKESCELITKDFITLTDNNLEFLLNQSFL